jgi:hypothetical protein
MGKEPRDNDKGSKDWERQDRGGDGRKTERPGREINDVTDWDKAPRPERDKDKKE